MLQSVSVLGCGWLGMPLALELKEMGFSVKGSTTTELKIKVLKDLGIKSYHISLSPELKGDDLVSFFDSHYLIINIPPAIARQGEDFHIQQMNSLRDQIQKSPVKKIIYISSTSVYPDVNRVVEEEDVLTIKDAGNKTLFEAESIIRHLPGIEFLILRCGGLAGYDRNLVKHFAGKNDLPLGNAPVNLIHRDDVIEIIKKLLTSESWNETLNICAPTHPLRKDFYPELAKKYNYPVPHYKEDDDSPYKIISIDKLQQMIHYKFKFPDPLHFFYNS